MLDKEKRSIFLGESLLIGIFTIGSYLVAFSFEAGFLNYFKLPIDLLFIRLENLFITLTILGSFFVLLGFSLEIFFSFRPTRDSVLFYIFNLFFSFFLLLIPMLYVKKINWIPILAWLIFAFFYLITPFLYKKEKTYFNKLTRAIEDDNKHLNILEKLGEFTGDKNSIFFCFFLYSLWVSFLLGEFQARKEKFFITASIDKEKFAIIRNYRENVIFLEINEDKKTFGKKFYVKDSTQLTNFLLERKELGNLTPSN